MTGGPGWFSLSLALLLPLSAGSRAAAQPATRPSRGEPAQWIWSAGGENEVRFRRTIDLPPDARIASAWLVLTADDACAVFVNGKLVARKNSSWQEVAEYDVAAGMAAGANLLAVEARNGGGPCGFVGQLTVKLSSGSAEAGDGGRLVVPTDGRWKASADKSAGWETADFDDSAWPGARLIGPLGVGPWGGLPVCPTGSSARAAPLPTTRPLSKETADSLIELDWLMQAGYDANAARSLQEIGWARQLAERLARHATRPDFKDELAELAGLEAKLAALPPDDPGDEATGLYLAVRRAKRRIALRNPVLDFARVLLVDTDSYCSAHESAHRNGYGYGGQTSRLIVLDGLRPDGAVHELLPPDAGYIMRMDLSFDASRIVFSMKPRKERSFHLYEVNADGTGLRQLTDGPYDDMDPIYLPDGHIIFSTSRGNTYVRCLPDSASTVLARCDPDGRNIYLISRNSEPDYTPCLLPDGRVLYTRWEYTERPLWRLQKLWTINPDGTGESVYWGNRSERPDVTWEARPIPGTEKVMFAGVGHHDVISGCLGVLDVAAGREHPQGIAKVTPDVRWPEVGDSGQETPCSSAYHAAGKFVSYRCPYPLGPEDFLVSALPDKQTSFLLYLMDIHGNRELIYRGNRNAWYPMPLRVRPPPRRIPDRVAWARPGEPAADGVLFSPNVYDGTAGLAPGQARFLRVIQQDAKTYTMMRKTWRHSGPTISPIQEDAVKRILGTAPIESDGSVAFRVPAGQALYFQLLDEQQRCLQVMRSFTGVMPGEVRGCLGCHEMQIASPSSQGSNAIALRKPPVKLTPPPWGAEVTISYERFAQPVLDKHCGRCHQGEGPGRAQLDLTLRGGTAEEGIADPALLPFKEPYVTLLGPTWSGPRPQGRHGIGIAGCMNVETVHRYGPIPPMTVLSYVSPLIKRVISGAHHDVRIEGEDLLRLIAWVDCNCVYRGDEEVRRIPDPEARRPSRWPVPPRTQSAPVIDRTQPINPSPDR